VNMVFSRLRLMADATTQCSIANREKGWRAIFPFLTMGLALVRQAMGGRTCGVVGFARGAMSTVTRMLLLSFARFQAISRLW
jgi:hypothetical protein